ncbi:MAG: hypothetical protein EA384_10200 [Spirochaetaceae bacterium]|nr:MAG: hypothetical protein EA384_10200 [Spirochaetaceae bacterium]
MRKRSLLAIAAVAAIAQTVMVACGPGRLAVGEEPVPARTLAGRHVGYSWGGEARGTSFEDATQYIETILTLDEDGIITAAKVVFWVQRDGYWIPRSSGNAYVTVDYRIDPSPATPGDNYSAGESMFTIYTVDMMSFYAAGVSPDNVAAVAIVCPVTRYQFEMKFDRGFDFDTPFAEVTIAGGDLVPTWRTSGSGLMRPQDWAEIADLNFFEIDLLWSHVVNDHGVLAGVTPESSVREFLEALGVGFDGGRPRPKDVSYGYFGIGGWAGNHAAIAQSLIGQDATSKTSLVDWSIERYAGAINENNVFGVDVATGATRTVQNSFDGISGATVRISREATSYQRALVDAGILDESDVIIGRF